MATTQRVTRRFSRHDLVALVVAASLIIGVGAAVVRGTAHPLASVATRAPVVYGAAGQPITTRATAPRYAYGSWIDYRVPRTAAAVSAAYTYGSWLEYRLPRDAATAERLGSHTYRSWIEYRLPMNKP